MGLFDSWFKKQIAEEDDDSEESWDVSDISQIWDIEDKSNMIGTLYEHLSDKCANGGNQEALSEKEFTLYLCLVLEDEVSSGGFGQFFQNTSGDYLLETLQALKSIGAVKTAAVYEKALSVFPDSNIPNDRFKRQELLDTLDQEKFDEADDEFYKYEADLLETSYAYAVSNRSSIS